MELSTAFVLTQVSPLSAATVAPPRWDLPHTDFAALSKQSDATTLDARAEAWRRLLALLQPPGGIMWRTPKADVLAELGLPPQRHHLTRLELSAIERHFYGRQHRDCAAKARAALPAALLAAADASLAANGAEAPAGAGGADAADIGPSPGSVSNPDDEVQIVAAAASGQSAAAAADDVNRPLTEAEQKKLLLPLLRLRQAACHPQARETAVLG